MKIAILFVSFLLYTLTTFSSLAYADCSGCCTDHGGVICAFSRTMCKDSSSLTDICIDNGCNVCPEKSLTEIKEPGDYDRTEWKHWIDEDGDCQDTRAELLIKFSKIPVTFNETNCLVVSGKWFDYYYPETLEKAEGIDIDHVVPLKHAHDHGGKLWSPKEKEIFANDPENLVITNLQYNRQKGSKGIDEWVPNDKKYACRYVKRWFLIKHKYNLVIDEEEIKFSDLLKCDETK